jgi:uncharacterized membrane protein HdeD (DUF308 family)
MKRMTLQNLLILVAVVFGFLYLYATYASVSSLELVSAIGALVFGVAAIILFYLRSPQRRPGEQVSY